MSDPLPSPAAPGAESARPVAFQGEPGAYSEAAVLEHFGAGTPTLPCESFDAVFSAVESGQAACGLIAIENSLAGSIHHNYDLLLQHQLWITGEHYLRVRHCLIANPGVEMNQVRKVISHPQALAQCAAYLRGLSLPGEVFYDTAGSVKHLKETGARDMAGIASRRAAEVYGMHILAEGIEDNPANFTRFLVISRESTQLTAAAAQPGSRRLQDSLEQSGSLRLPENQAKTTIAFTLNNRPGSLYRALSVFALRDIDLSKIESRPLVGRPWEYLFYIDILTAMSNPAAARALANLEEYAMSVRVLGSYTRHNM